MGTVTRQTPCEILEPGTYRVRVGAVAVEEGPYGTQVVMRFDLLDEGYDLDFANMTFPVVSCAGRCARPGETGIRQACPIRLCPWVLALVGLLVLGNLL